MVNLKYCILGVEGPHDQAYIGKLFDLQRWGRFDGQRDSIDPFWEKFIPIIAQDGWICEKTVNGITEVALLWEFLKDLLELPENLHDAKQG